MIIDPLTQSTQDYLKHIFDFSSLPGSYVNGGTLPPGTYGQVDLRFNSVTLLSGVYVIDSFRAGNGWQIDIDLSLPASRGPQFEALPFCKNTNWGFSCIPREAPCRLVPYMG